MGKAAGRRRLWPTSIAVLLALACASCTSPANEPGFVVVDPSLSTRIVVVPEPRPTRREAIAIHAVGDVVAVPSVATNGSLRLAGVADLFTADALTIANLVCSLSDPVADPVDPADPSDRSVCDASLVADFATAGIDVMSVANDDSVLRGRQALVDTVETIAASAMRPVGGGPSQTEAYAPVFTDVGGWRIAVVAMTAVGSNFATARSPGVAAVERTKQAVAAVALARAQADVVIATVHWGRPLDRDAERRDRDYANTLIDAGVDAIVGHGPHRLQSFALVDERPVFWSLGHLLWPLAEPADADSAIARLEIDAEGTLVACLVPVTITREAGPQLDRPDSSCAARTVDG